MKEEGKTQDEICGRKIEVSILYGRNGIDREEKVISMERFYENVSRILENWKLEKAEE